MDYKRSKGWICWTQSLLISLHPSTPKNASVVVCRGGIQGLSMRYRELEELASDSNNMSLEGVTHH